MGEPKPSASLSSGLLARKGAARPAMRRQGLGAVSAGTHDDLGWNDMGYDLDAESQQLPAAMPGVSPLSVKPGHAPHSDDIRDQEVVDSPEGDDSNIARLTNSPLSVKPGKPQVVLQREELEGSFDTSDQDEAQEDDEWQGDYADPVPAYGDNEDDTNDYTAEDGDDAEEEEIAGRTASLLSVKPEFERETRLNTEIGEEVYPDVDENTVVAEDAAPIFEQAFEPPKLEAQPSPTKPVQAAPEPVQLAKANKIESELPKSRSTKAKAAFTLRIDRDRHLKLRLASALTGMSAQHILTDAFDRYLETLPEVEALADNISRRAAT